MQIVYEKYKGQEITEGKFVAGYSNDHIILATEEHPKPKTAFRRLDKNSFVDEQYKDKAFHYVYCDESWIEKQLGEWKLTLL